MLKIHQRFSNGFLFKAFEIFRIIFTFYAYILSFLFYFDFGGKNTVEIYRNTKHKICTNKNNSIKNIHLSKKQYNRAKLLQTKQCKYWKPKRKKKRIDRPIVLFFFKLQNLVRIWTFSDAKIAFSWKFISNLNTSGLNVTS